jgi:hypothetical protein
VRGWGGRGKGREGGVREGVGAGGRNDQALCSHMNKIKIKKKSDSLNLRAYSVENNF